MQDHETDFARPWAPHRLRIYTGTALFVLGMFLLLTIAISLRIIPASFRVDVIANMIFGIPVMLLPFVILWEAPGEHRGRLDRAAELTLFYIPFTAAS
ncbi:emopamil-binding protein, partial [Mycolicibacter kumamotonensis]|nr:emopamil-binding protein [Mycolicibacter kumamotonensis]